MSWEIWACPNRGDEDSVGTSRSLRVALERGETWAELNRLSGCITVEPSHERQPAVHIRYDDGTFTGLDYTRPDLLTPGEQETVDAWMRGDREE